MNRSENIATLAAALCAAQAEIRGAAKDAENPLFRSKYATLASVWDACREPLTSNGLSIVQVPEATGEPGTCTLTTVLLHTSGEWLSSTFTVPVLPQIVNKGQDPVQSPQGYGSALTYARRYALSAMVGIAPDDDDGNAASQTAPARSFQPPRTEKPPLNRAAAIRKIKELGGDVGHAETLSDDALVAYGKALKSLPEEQKAAAVVDGESVSVVGLVDGKPFVNEKVCKFNLVTDEGSMSITAFPKNEAVWHLLVNGDGQFTASGEVLMIEGKWSVKDGYDPSIIAHQLSFGGEETE